MRRIVQACFARLWRHQWAVVGVLAATAFALGMLGLFRLEGRRPWSWPDAIYFSLRLFAFDYDLGGGGSDPYATGNWQLWVARFLAPMSTGLAVVKAVAQSIASRIDLWRVSHWNGHAVICGAGERGHHLALSLRREGKKKVVVIDKEEDAGTRGILRRNGVLTICGNGTDPAILAAARVDTAAVVVALTPSVETNLEVVLAASRRKNGVPGKAFAYAPRSFAMMFEGQKPFRRDENTSRTQSVECGFFDHSATAARVLVNKYAPGLGQTLFRQQRGAHILLAGDGEVLPELLGVLIAQCQFAGSHLPHITLLTDDENAIARGFPLYHPQLSLVVDLQTTMMPMARMLSVSMTQLNTNRNKHPFDLLFVACREDGDTLTLAMNLAQQSSPAQSVIAGLTPSTRLDQKFERYFSTPQPLEGVTLYNLLTLGCEERDVVRHELDQKARDIHLKYFDERQREGGERGDSLAMHPWEDLRGDFRESNRSAADHIAVKVQILRLFQSEQTIELLAEAEHRRWMAERIVSGWRHAASRNDHKRLHHNFVPYNALSEGDREKDRENVRKALASASTPVADDFRTTGQCFTPQ
jgi:voltage-gated potassium channel Kch